MALQVLFPDGTCTATSGFFVSKQKGAGSQSPRELKVDYQVVSIGPDDAERRLNSAFDLLFESALKSRSLTNEKRIKAGSIGVLPVGILDHTSRER